MDVIDGLLDDERWAVLRRQRPDYVRHSQGSHEVLIVPKDPAGISLAERAAAAVRIATLNGDVSLTAHYQALLDPATSSMLTGDPMTPRLAAILAHVERVATAPRTATPAHLHALQAVGLSPRDIVTLSQLIAFVSYQVRVLAGMRLLIGEHAA